ncbi:hypothetical protein [Piscinibacter sp.]|uniref:hypothetical protein n=1 Tax=Piscinibacter sp. TaxID=1903157 RepID=UPI002C2B7D7D|nr:hypothetical protein [Albitalea sp.]HUG24162.1 hypothetical protein [Albitalea sp.]
MTPHTRTLLPLRRDALSETLLDTVELLKRRRASHIAERDIDDYVALNWLEWDGGALKLTTVGENLCKRLSEQLA